MLSSCFLWSLLMIGIDYHMKLQVQHTFQKAHPEVDNGSGRHQRSAGALAVRAEPVGVSGGRVCGGGHRQAAAQGG